jgi:seryl-tRNA synthetase
LRTENAQLKAELEAAQAERDRVSREFGNMKREAEESWASERVENALLRERINDVAAEVARLASALEGPNSPIDAILAAETARDRVSLSVVSSNPEVALADIAPAGGNLADRIRALQTHASRLPNEDDPKTPN